MEIIKNIYHKLYANRFELFFAISLITLFGSLIFPTALFEDTFMPVFLLAHIFSGIILISKRRTLTFIFTGLFVISLFVYGRDMMMQPKETDMFQFGQMGIYFVFYIIVTVDIIGQIWKANHVSKNVIIGLMSGYIALGLVAFFMFLTIEMATPGSFEGLYTDANDIAQKTDSLMYYSFITLLTIGYGDIIPLTTIAQKAAVLTGLAGQFYIVIITAVVVEKYIRHSVKDN